MDVSVNYLAVFLAAASSMVVGSVWYAKSTFGETWAKLAKVDLSKAPSASQFAWLNVCGVACDRLHIGACCVLVEHVLSKRVLARYAHDSVLALAWFYCGTFLRPRCVRRASQETLCHECCTRTRDGTGNGCHYRSDGRVEVGNGHLGYHKTNDPGQAGL